MLIGYMRVSKADGSQVVDLQRDALVAAGVAAEQLYTDRASGKRDDRPGLEACLKALRAGDTLVIWKLDRLGRNLKHLVDVVQRLNDRGVGLKVLAGQGASIDTTTANGRLMFNFFAALAEFERELIIERTVAGLAAARARGRSGGRPFKMMQRSCGWRRPRWASPRPASRSCVRNWGSRGRRSIGTSRQQASSGQMARRCSSAEDRKDDARYLALRRPNTQKLGRSVRVCDTPTKLTRESDGGP